MNFSLERSLNIYQTTLFQLYPQDPSLPDGKLKAGHLFKVFNFMKIMQKGFPDVFHGTYQRWRDGCDSVKWHHMKDDPRSSSISIYLN